MIKIATTQAEYFALMSVRAHVFILEQNVPVLLEIDENDQQAIHFVYYHNNSIVATARITCHEYYSIGRVCVLKDFRHLNIGTQLMHYMHDYLKSINVNEVHLSAQVSALPFYLSLGYKPYGEIYLDANIKHQSAVKTLD